MACAWHSPSRQARNDLDVRPVAEALAIGPLAAKHLVRTYHDQLHGWAAARGDRSDPRVVAAVRCAPVRVGADVRIGSGGGSGVG